MRVTQLHSYSTFYIRKLPPLDSLYTLRGRLECHVTRQEQNKKDLILRTDKNIHVRNKTLDQNEMLHYMTKCYVTRQKLKNPLIFRTHNKNIHVRNETLEGTKKKNCKIKGRMKKS